MKLSYSFTIHSYTFFLLFYTIFILPFHYLFITVSHHSFLSSFHILSNSSFLPAFLVVYSSLSYSFFIYFFLNFHSFTKFRHYSFSNTLKFKPDRVFNRFFVIYRFPITFIILRMSNSPSRQSSIM